MLIQYIQIFISNHIFNMIALNNREVALPDKICPHYPLLGITLYTPYNYEYYSLK